MFFMLNKTARILPLLWKQAKHFYESMQLLTECRRLEVLQCQLGDMVCLIAEWSIARYATETKY